MFPKLNSIGRDNNILYVGAEFDPGYATYSPGWIFKPLGYLPKKKNLLNFLFEGRISIKFI
jgi:hypothetical protein